MTGPMSHGEFQQYLDVLQRLLQLRRRQREAIAEELRSHLESRFADLIEQGVAPKEAVSRALAEFGDAAALAAEFTSIAKVQRRKRIMRLTIGSVAAAVVASVIVLSVWPEPGGVLPVSGLHAQQTQAGSAADKAPAQKADANEQTWARLEQLIVADFVDTPLSDVIDYLSEILDVQTYVDRGPLEEQGISLDTPVNLTLHSVPGEMVLRLVLRQVELDYSLDNGVIIITTPDAAQETLAVRVYQVDDLVEPRRQHEPAPKQKGCFGGAAGAAPAPKGASPAKDQAASGGAASGETLGSGRDAAAPHGPPPYDVFALRDVITSTVAPDSWEEMGGSGVITEFRGTLIVSQTWRRHREIDLLLQQLRSALGSQSLP